MYTTFYGDDIFSLLLKNWTRPVKESTGYTVVSTKDGYQIVANILGIKEKDLVVKIEKGILSIQGKTEIEKINFTNSVNYQFDVSSIKGDILEVKYDIADGLIVLNVILKQAKEKEIKITKG